MTLFRTLIASLLMSAAGLAVADDLYPASRAESAIAVPNTRPAEDRQRPLKSLLPTTKRFSAETPGSEIPVMKKRPSRGGVRPETIGHKRRVQALQTAQRVREELDWQQTPEGGRLATLAISSPGSAALRLGVRIFAMPSEARIRVHRPGATDGIEVTGAEIRDIIIQNQTAGDPPELANTWWSPMVEGDEASIEIELPPGVDDTQVRFALPQISHLTTNATRDWITQSSAALACHNDVRCHPDWDGPSRATAHVVVTDDGFSYLCSGTLLNDKDDDSFVPYFLSAEHCVYSQSVASTVETHWFHRSAWCNNALPSAERATLIGGARLLYTSTATDTAFMRLSTQPPPGAVFAGWRSSTPRIWSTVAGLHHPQGEMQKISFGTLQSYQNCETIDTESFGCMSSSALDSNHVEVQWSSGTTEPGSSGSGLFDAGQYLIGNLHGGTASSSCSGTRAYYGRFDLAYEDQLHEFLAAPTAITREVMSLRDAIYLYNQPIRSNTSLHIAGDKCDVLQLVLDVKSGFTELRMQDSTSFAYPDRINDSAAMFAYALYSDAQTKAFSMQENAPIGADREIGTATVFGYCFSTKADATVFIYDSKSGLCRLSDGTSNACTPALH